MINKFSVRPRFVVPAVVVALTLGFLSLLMIALCQNWVEGQYRYWRPDFDITGAAGMSPIVNEKQINRLSVFSLSLGFYYHDLNAADLLIRFCDQYSVRLLRGKVWLWAGDREKTQEYILLGDLPAERDFGRAKTMAALVSGIFKPKKLRLKLLVDLQRNHLIVYANDIPLRHSRVGSDLLHYRVCLKDFSLSSRMIFSDLKITDGEGRVLFTKDCSFLLLLGIIAPVLFVFSILILVSLMFIDGTGFRKFLYCVLILLALEYYLRIYDKLGDLNILERNNKWIFSADTALLPNISAPDVTIFNRRADSLDHVVALRKPEDSKRIFVVGASPVWGAHLDSRPATAFPALLQKKFNAGGAEHIQVIPCYEPGTAMLSPRINIFLQDVLFRLDPDVVVIYGLWAAEEQSANEEHSLYSRAVDIMARNSEWIRTDRQLYSALEFKTPLKAVVELYGFLNHSYLFVYIDDLRKLLFSKWYRLFAIQDAIPPKDYLGTTMRQARERNISILFIPMVTFDFTHGETVHETPLSGPEAEMYPEIILDITGSFRKATGMIRSYDRSHPSEYGHQIIAEEIFRKIQRDRLLEARPGGGGKK